MKPRNRETKSTHLLLPRVQTTLILPFRSIPHQHTIRNYVCPLVPLSLPPRQIPDLEMGRQRCPSLPILSSPLLPTRSPPHRRRPRSRPRLEVKREMAHKTQPQIRHTRPLEKRTSGIPSHSSSVTAPRPRFRSANCCWILGRSARCWVRRADSRASLRVRRTRKKERKERARRGGERRGEGGKRIREG
ncbi:hypothetical protein FA13DRAFT_345331 [Coprinellus micaceus]|uniref:Uncharacterized protein n=1 Tax=Coprinellus micaceus TaxID=71717 RepID=A0A4Y7SDU2_COPMI|nr:hypothetical protein FA13DRAFT_345331 [Coprinellus micaceus]